MTDNRPPYPGANLAEWAVKLYQYMVRQTAVDARNEPQPILLLHRVASVLYRASTPGIMLFEPRVNAPIASVEGRWEVLGDYQFLEVSYDVGAAVAGATLATGQNVVPYNEPLKVPIWATFDDTTGRFTLIEGRYYLTASITISKSASGNHILLAYLAETSDLTTPISHVISHASRFVTSYPTGVPQELLLSGNFEVPQGGGEYCIVVVTDNGGVNYGVAHGFTGIPNVCATLKISLTGVP